MVTRQWLASVLAGLLVVNGLTAQSSAPSSAPSVALTEAPLAQRCFRNELTTELEGKISVKQDGKKEPDVYPLQVQAKHVFQECHLDVNGSVADKSARAYSVAEGSVRFNNEEPARHTLRPACAKLMVAQRLKDQIVHFSPHKQLTREEMELTEHFDTMAVSGLVPGKEIAVGKTWTLPNHVVLALCDLNALTEQNLECTLVALKGAIAHVNLVGNVKGIDMGAQVSMLINGRLEFDTSVQRVVYVEWKQEDERQQGPISPALRANVTIKLKRTPIDEPEELNKFARVPIPDTMAPPAHMTNIHHQDAQKRYELKYTRDWHVTTPGPQLVMRLMDRGDFIAQVTVSSWKKIDPKNVITLKDFAKEMAETPGWEMDKEDEPKEITDRPRGHHTVYRTGGSGELDGVKTWQYFYLIVSPQGEQVIMTFAVVPQQVQHLGVRDLELVRELIFPETADNANPGAK